MPRDELSPRDRTRLPAVALALLLTGLAGACSDMEPRTDPAEERAAVEAALDSGYAAFREAYARANVQLLMNEVYAPDAYYLPPGSPILEGQDQFRGQFSFLERYARDDGPGPRIAFEVIDRQIDGGLAYDIGTYTLQAPDAPPDADRTRGKFVIVWERNQAGEWRIHADAFSPVQ